MNEVLLMPQRCLVAQCSASICFNQANTSREFGISIWLSKLDSLCTFCQSL